jgi:hypothetical protein
MVDARAALSDAGGAVRRLDEVPAKWRPLLELLAATGVADL